MSAAAHFPGRPVPPERAAAVVRRVARAHRAGHIVKQLSQIRPDRVARARTRFASAMTDDEVALVLVDTSFWRNGAAGLLLTNRAIYSSWLPAPIDLAGVETARHRPPDRRGVVAVELLVALAHFFPPALVLMLPLLLLRKRNRNQHTLLVNERVVFAGTRNLSWAFWEDVLVALREELDGPARQLRVRVLEVLTADAEPLRATAPPWEAIERSVRALDGIALRAARLWAGEPGRSAGLEVVADDGGYSLRELPTGRADNDPDLERVLDMVGRFAQTGSLERRER
jgi:hypothetical protein